METQWQFFFSPKFFAECLIFSYRYSNLPEHQQQRAPGTVSNDQECVLAAVPVEPLGSTFCRVAPLPVGHMINNMAEDKKKMCLNEVLNNFFFYFKSK